MTLLFALLNVAVGVALLFGGYRLARILIPLMGFVFGLSLGGALFADLAGEVFLGTTISIIVGLGAALVFAVLAYLSYYGAVIVLAGGLGYWLGSGFVLLLGFSPGLLSAFMGIGLGIAFGLLSFMINAPKYILVTLTSVTGAVLTVGGFMLLFHTVPLELYSYTTARLAISNSFLWALAAASMVVIGCLAQVSLNDNYDLEEWTMTDHDHVQPPTTTPHVSSGVS